MKENFDYSALDSMPKLERRQAMEDSGKLDRRRFLLPENEILRDRLHKLQHIVTQFTTEYPELISFGLFGSNTKGYATLESDIDGILYINLRPAVASYRKNHPETDVPSAMQAVKDKYVSLLQERLIKELDLNKEQVKNVRSRFVDGKSTIETLRKTQPDEQAIKDLFPYFLMEIGSGIQKYRELIINELEQQGKAGLEKWNIIMDRLAWFENFSKDKSEASGEERANLYPRNFAQARRIFLKQPAPKELSKAA